MHRLEYAISETAMFDLQAPWRSLGLSDSLHIPIRLKENGRLIVELRSIVIALTAHKWHAYSQQMHGK
jgi:hypothetical protein